MKLLKIFVWLLIFGCHGLLFSSPDEQDRKNKVILLLDQARNNPGRPMTTKLDGDLHNKEFKNEVANLLHDRFDMSYKYHIGVVDQDMTITAQKI